MRIFHETQDSQADINRFALLGAVTLVVIGAGLLGMRSYAQQSLKQDNLEAPWIVAARAQHGTSARIERGYSDPVVSSEIRASVARR